MTVTETSQRYREFTLPDVGEGLTEAEILKWYVAPGDTVSDGQVVCEVETAKAAVELPIPFDGVVQQLHVKEGTTVDVGTPIITVDTAPGVAQPAPETVAAAETGPELAVAKAPEGPEAAKAAEAEAPAQKRQAVLVGYGVLDTPARRRRRKQVSSEAPGQGSAGEHNGGPAAAPEAARALAKPPVRKLAKDLGIDLTTVRPTGPGGTITREDVQAAATPAVEAPQAAVAAPADVSRETGIPRERRVPIKGVRKATAAAMVSSAFTAPHVTEFITIDVTRSMRLVAELKTDPAFNGLKVSPLLLVAKALLVAVRRNPEVNASWDEQSQEIVYKDYVNLGIAAATPRGLIVPNIKDAQAKTLPELAAALDELVSTAREGKTPPSAMQGGTVTITNVGVFGVDTGTPIINPGESAILAFGAVKEQPWVHQGKVKPRLVTTLALSFDHRLVDGELGSKVLADVAAVLERPKRLITWA